MKFRPDLREGRRRPWWCRPHANTRRGRVSISAGRARCRSAPTVVTGVAGAGGVDDVRRHAVQMDVLALLVSAGVVPGDLGDDWRTRGQPGTLSEAGLCRRWGGRRPAKALRSLAEPLLGHPAPAASASSSSDRMMAWGFACRTLPSERRVDLLVQEDRWLLPRQMRSRVEGSPPAACTLPESTAYLQVAPALQGGLLAGGKLRLEVGDGLLAWARSACR